MKSSRYTAEQIAFALRQAKSDAPVLEVCRKMGSTSQPRPGDLCHGGHSRGSMTHATNITTGT